MSQAAPRQHSVLSILNTDGKPHPVENTLTVATLVLGTVAFVTALLTERQVTDLHLLCSWTGAVGLVTGAWGQLISATTAERFVLIIGMGAAGFGLLLGMAYGGPFGGLLG